MSTESGVSGDVKMIPATEVKVGDTLQTRNGGLLKVTRIDTGFMGNPGFIAFVEDTADQWLKMPSPSDGEVGLIATS